MSKGEGKVTGPADNQASLKAAQQVYAQILARAPESDLEPDRERISALMDVLGDPHRSAPVVHITGTNGKTSTARMVESLLREKGLRTGRFTSPHLASVRERIAIDGEPISSNTFVAVYEDVEPYVAMVDQRSVASGGPRMTFFEVLTGMAFAAFADAPVDVIVLEVGMGGSWDATNVADGKVAVLTPMSHDHERWLGHQLVDIAAEKVGIIKDRAHVVSAHQRADVAEIVEVAAREHHASLARDGEEIGVVDTAVAVGGQLLTLRTRTAVYEDIFVPLHGAHQAHNALLALAAVEFLLFDGIRPLEADIVEAGFAAVTSPGRLEVVRNSPTVIVDAAHNPAGAEAAVEALDDVFAFTRLVGVVGVLDDKDAEGILAVLEPVLADVVVTRSTSSRAVAPEDLATVATDVFGPDRVHIADRLDNAIDAAVQLAEADADPAGRAGVLVIGSVTLAAEVRTLFGLT